MYSVYLFLYLGCQMEKLLVWFKIDAHQPKLLRLELEIEWSLCHLWYVIISVTSPLKTSISYSGQSPFCR
jgi:hypothetical protein